MNISRCCIFVVTLAVIFSQNSCYGELPFEVWKEQGDVSAVFAKLGDKFEMEDFFIRLEDDFEIGVFAILDGHDGDYAANFTKEYLTKAFNDILLLSEANKKKCKYAEGPEGKLNFERMSTDFIDQVEKNLETTAIKERRSSGTTCLLVIAEQKMLTVANVGDSRAVMCDVNGKAVDLSIDHKPIVNKKETERVENAKGKIKYGGGAHRIEGLAMSRSLGDYRFKQKAGKDVIISKPEISTFNLNKHRPKFMILASDGLWDVMKSQEAVDFIKNCYMKDEDFGASALARKAYDLNSGDNISVMVIIFKDGYYQVARTWGKTYSKFSKRMSKAFFQR